VQTARDWRLYKRGSRRTKENEAMMKGMAVGAFALVLGISAVPASAAPLGTLDGIKSEDTAAAEQVSYRRCWWHKGHRHCRRYGGHGYYPYYGYGYPGFTFYFGGGRHRHHHHRRHW
jgi:hypothetical protein